MGVDIGSCAVSAMAQSIARRMAQRMAQRIAQRIAQLGFGDVLLGTGAERSTAKGT